MLNYGQQLVQQFVFRNQYNLIYNLTINTSKKATITTMTYIIITRLTIYIKDVVKDIDIAIVNIEEDSAAPKVATEVATNIIQKEETLTRDTIEIIKDIKEDLIRRNTIFINIL